jgi:hypothetical protein
MTLGPSSRDAALFNAGRLQRFLPLTLGPARRFWNIF